MAALFEKIVKPQAEELMEILAVQCFSLLKRVSTTQFLKGTHLLLLSLYRIGMCLTSREGIS